MAKRWLDVSNCITDDKEQTHNCGFGDGFGLKLVSYGVFKNDVPLFLRFSLIFMKRQIRKLAFPDKE